MVIADFVRTIGWLGALVVVVGIPLSFLFPFDLVVLVTIASMTLGDALGDLWAVGQLAAWEKRNDARLLAASGGDERSYYRRSPRL